MDLIDQIITDVTKTLPQVKWGTPLPAKLIFGPSFRYDRIEHLTREDSKTGLKRIFLFLACVRSIDQLIIFKKINKIKQSCKCRNKCRYKFDLAKYTSINFQIATIMGTVSLY